jgi:DNA-binding response OmpR family regulator
MEVAFASSKLPLDPTRVRVLLVEDSLRLQNIIARGLRESGFAVDTASDGRQAFINVQTTVYDVVILDLMIPEIDGLTVLRKMREKAIETHVLILTALDGVDDRVLGLQSGADDYLAKPFSFKELLARVQALARRSHGSKSSTVAVGPLLIDMVTRQARIGGDMGASLDLTPRQFAILQFLALRQGKPVSRPELEEHLYDQESQVLSNAVDSAVCLLRAKLEAAGCPPLIHTRRKIGYVLSETAP